MMIIIIIIIFPGTATFVKPKQACENCSCVGKRETGCRTQWLCALSWQQQLSQLLKIYNDTTNFLCPSAHSCKILRQPALTNLWKHLFTPHRRQVLAIPHAAMFSLNLTHTHTHTHRHAHHTHTHTHSHTHTHTHSHTHTHTQLDTHTHTHMHICMQQKREQYFFCAKIKYKCNFYSRTVSTTTPAVQNGISFSLIRFAVSF